jgi:hypothetical protein
MTVGGNRGERRHDTRSGRRHYHAVDEGEADKTSNSVAVVRFAPAATENVFDGKNCGEDPHSVICIKNLKELGEC